MLAATRARSRGLLLASSGHQLGGRLPADHRAWRSRRWGRHAEPAFGAGAVSGGGSCCGPPEQIFRRGGEPVAGRGKDHGGDLGRIGIEDNSGAMACVKHGNAARPGISGWMVQSRARSLSRPGRLSSTTSSAAASASTLCCMTPSA